MPNPSHSNQVAYDSDRQAALSPPALNGRAAARGFSLIELVVVVIIIGVLAVIAIPSISKRLKDRRASELAQQFSQTYRNARMRALGRGGAVLVRYTKGTAGAVEVREGVVGTSGACAELPSNGCDRAWLVEDSRQISSLDVSTHAEYENMKVVMSDPASAEVNSMDVCYTPLGRTFVRYAAAGPFIQLVGTPSANVARYSGGSKIGLQRRVVILPNGTARLGIEP